MAHPDPLLPFDGGEQAVVPGDRHARRAVFAAVGRDDVTAELERHHLGPVADAQDRDTAGPHGRVRTGCIRVVDRHRAARQDDRPRAAALELLERGVVGQELRVDVELADAAGDELGELAAEIEDRDGAVRRPVSARWAVVGGALGGGRLEGGLEVCLDLGVVRSEDSVAGVGRLAVDGLPASRRRRCVRVAQSTSRLDPPIPDRAGIKCTGRRPAGSRVWRAHGHFASVEREATGPGGSTMARMARPRRRSVQTPTLDIADEVSGREDGTPGSRATSRPTEIARASRAMWVSLDSAWRRRP